MRLSSSCAAAGSARESRQHALAIEHCRLVIEVESPSSGGIDRVTKSGPLAEAGLQYYWRVEFSSDDWERSAVVTAYELVNGGYKQVTQATAGQIFVVSAPVSVSFDPAVLTR